jgi:hypothetical protein
MSRFTFSHAPLGQHRPNYSVHFLGTVESNARVPLNVGRDNNISNELDNFEHFARCNYVCFGAEVQRSIQLLLVDYKASSQVTGTRIYQRPNFRLSTKIEKTSFLHVSGNISTMAPSESYI